MAKVKIQGHASGTGILTVTAPNTSTDRTITLPDATDTLIGAATTDALTTRINATGGRKNMLINGAMQVAQRETSVTGITSNAYRTCDRWKLQTSGTGTWTMIQEALTSGAAKEAGFGFATRIDCTTAVASPSSGSYLYLKYMIEGQDLQGLAKGTSGAKAITISFWVKTTTTGVYQLSVRDANTRMCAGTYTVNSADTWEKKSITIPADTSGAIANTNAEGMDLSFWLGAGSNYTGGAAPTAWEAKVDTDRAAAMSHQMSSATSKDWAITGLQMELGSVATDFEHRSYGEELALCQRYYTVGSMSNTNVTGMLYCGNSVMFPQTMRATPTVTISDDEGNAGKCSADATDNVAAAVRRTTDAYVSITVTNTAIGNNVFYNQQFAATAEL